MSDTPNCNCGHAYRAHGGESFLDCTVPGCACPIYDPAVPEVVTLRAALDDAKRGEKVGSDRAKALGARLENVARAAAWEALRHAGPERAPQATEWVKHAVAFVRSLVEAGANDDAIKKAEDERDTARAEAEALRGLIVEFLDAWRNTASLDSDETARLGRAMDALAAAAEVKPKEEPTSASWRTTCSSCGEPMTVVRVTCGACCAKNPQPGAVTVKP